MRALKQRVLDLPDEASLRDAPAALALSKRPGGRPLQEASSLLLNGIHHGDVHSSALQWHKPYSGKV